MQIQYKENIYYGSSKKDTKPHSPFSCNLMKKIAFPFKKK